MDLVSQYFQYTRETEAPRIYHRWCLLTSVGALLARRTFIQHGHFKIYPNLYTMLIGEPATRKSTSIKIIKKLLVASGYDTIAADKTRQEKFLMDLEGLNLDDVDVSGPGGKPQYDGITAENLWGKEGMQDPREMFVMADEFNNFIGVNNTDFCSLLGELWDWDNEHKPYTHRLKNSRSVSIYQPTVSVLGGNTPENFSRAFPPEMLGQGFLSRLILIHGERTGKKIAFPTPPTDDEFTTLLTSFQSIRTTCIGLCVINSASIKLLEEIYTSIESDIADVRFEAYNNRRFTQLLKMCLVLCACKGAKEVDDAIIFEANTILAAAEYLMPKALGEFGKAKNSDVVNKIMAILEHAIKPVPAKELYQLIRRDLDRPSQMHDIMTGLQAAEQIQFVKDKGYLARRTAIKKSKYVDWNLLTDEERRDI